jgi:hypothetical protein
MVDLSETFYLTLMATGAGVLGLIIKKISSSKCDEISCFGLHVHRVVSLEKDDIEGQESKTNI